MPNAGPSYDEDGGQRRPGDQAHFAGQVHQAGRGSARPVLASTLTIFSRLACPAHYTTCVESCRAGEERW